MKLLDPLAFRPTRATPLSAGLDLKCPRDLVLRKDVTEVVDTGVSVRTPNGSYGRLEVRSSLAARGVDLLGGVIDRDYTGPIKLILRSADEEVSVKRGDRLAQLICEKIVIPKATLVTHEERPMEASGPRPARRSRESAGLRLPSPGTFFLGPKEQKTLDTGVVLDRAPPGTYARLACPPSLAARGVDVLSGIWDETDRLPVHVTLRGGETGLYIRRGDTIALVIHEEAFEPRTEEAEELPATTRGNQAFGSSGI